VWLNEWKEAANDDDAQVAMDGSSLRKGKTTRARKLTEEEKAQRARDRALGKMAAPPFYRADANPSPAAPACHLFNQSTFSLDLRGLQAHALWWLYQHKLKLREIRAQHSTSVSAAAEAAQAAFDEATKSTKLRTLPSLYIEVRDGNPANLIDGQAPFLGSVSVPAAHYLSNCPALEGLQLPIGEERLTAAQSKAQQLTNTTGKSLDFFSLQKVVCLELVVRGCEKLTPLEVDTMANPRVKLWWNGRFLGSTPVYKKTLNPRWTKNQTGDNSFRLVCMLITSLHFLLACPESTQQLTPL
jgi:hypothetical protein